MSELLTAEEMAEKLGIHLVKDEDHCIMETQAYSLDLTRLRGLLCAQLAHCKPLIEKQERERIAEVYIRYHDTIAPKDIRKLILDGTEPLGWEALKGATDGY